MRRCGRGGGEREEDEGGEKEGRRVGRGEAEWRVRMEGEGGGE